MSGKKKKKNKKKKPKSHIGIQQAKSSFIHPQASVFGMVTLGKNTSIWPGAVLRGDLGNIILGDFVNIQDHSTLHVNSRNKIEIGDYTLVGHNAILHGCKIGKACLIGIGCVILDGAEIEDGAMITAGCIIRGGKKIPARSLVIQKSGDIKIVEGKARTSHTIAGSLEYAELAKRFKKKIFKPFSIEQEKAFLAEGNKIVADLGI